MKYTTDSRWNAMREFVPGEAIAVYSARWIDNGDMFDVVPDRQGFAYNNAADRDRLISMLQEHDPKRLTMLGRQDGWQHVIAEDGDVGFICAMRRWGGYVYVEAWTF